MFVPVMRSPICNGGVGTVVNCTTVYGADIPLVIPYCPMVSASVGETL